ncbi:hypothetical protein [Sutcliffiella cohnii]|nr:hypothetical protein [Sutcliffiella cohnii]
MTDEKFLELFERNIRIQVALENTEKQIAEVRKILSEINKNSEGVK